MPRNTIRGFGKHLIDAAFLDPAQHCPQAGPCVFVDTRGAMYCIVRERFGDQFPAFALAPLAANPDLVFDRPARSEEHTSELPSLMRISYAVFCLKKKKTI